MVIKILGTGCKKCTALFENTEEALKNLGQEAGIFKVTDIKEIMAYGVMATPALVIDDKVVASGKILKSKEIAGLIEKNKNL